jgi:Uma2 family endonuclease
MINSTTQIMTAEDYFALPETLDRTDLIQGELIVSPAPTPEHQDIAFLIATVMNQVKKAGKVVVAPIDVHLGGKTVFQPDVMWLAPDSQCTQTPRYYQGAPDLVVEVLSPSTALRDKSVKFDLYEQFGVREYWLADYNAELIEIYVLAEGKFQRVGAYGFDETFESPLLGQIIIQPKQDAPAEADSEEDTDTEPK